MSVLRSILPPLLAGLLFFGALQYARHQNHRTRTAADRVTEADPAPRR